MDAMPIYLAMFLAALLFFAGVSTGMVIQSMRENENVKRVIRRLERRRGFVSRDRYI